MQGNSIFGRRFIYFNLVRSLRTTAFRPLIVDPRGAQSFRATTAAPEMTDPVSWVGVTRQAPPKSLRVGTFAHPPSGRPMSALPNDLRCPFPRCQRRYPHLGYLQSHIGEIRMKQGGGDDNHPPNDNIWTTARIVSFLRREGRIHRLLQQPEGTRHARKYRDDLKKPILAPKPARNCA